MKAAVVASPGIPPSYTDFTDPQASGDAIVLRVAASALSHLAKMRASGGHYSSASDGGAFVAGVDGVGIDDAGQRRYFLLPHAPFGSFAERVLVDRANCIALPDGIDDTQAAAIAIPGMSSWAALRERANFTAGETVLVNGATGASGRLAVQTAKYLGAGRVIATGRNTSVLATLGADACISLDSPDTTRQFEAAFASGVDVVLDYLWGASAETIFSAIGRAAPSEREVRFVQIGNIAGATITFPAAPLRSKRLVITGSGLGSVSNAGLFAAIEAMFNAVEPAGLHVQATEIPLANIGSVWSDIDASDRTVLIP